MPSVNERDRPEIEITEEMAAAGLAALEYGRDVYDEVQLVMAIYTAMCEKLPRASEQE